MPLPRSASCPLPVPCVVPCRAAPPHTPSALVLVLVLMPRRRLVVPASGVRRAEFVRTVTATAVGFFMMGFIGFFVKLIHIPINNIIVGGG